MIGTILNHLREEFGRRPFLGFLAVAIVGVLILEWSGTWANVSNAFIAWTQAKYTEPKLLVELEKIHQEVGLIAQQQVKTHEEVALIGQQQKKVEEETRTAKAIANNSDEQQKALAAKTTAEARSAQLANIQQEVATRALTGGDLAATPKPWPMVRTPLTGRPDWDQQNMAADQQDNLLGPSHTFYGFRMGDVQAQIVEPETDKTKFQATRPVEATKVTDFVPRDKCIGLFNDYTRLAKQHGAICCLCDIG